MYILPSNCYFTVFTCAHFYVLDLKWADTIGGVALLRWWWVAHVGIGSYGTIRGFYWNLPCPHPIALYINVRFPYPHPIALYINVRFPYPHPRALYINVRFPYPHPVALYINVRFPYPHPIALYINVTFPPISSSYSNMLTFTFHIQIL